VLHLFCRAQRIPGSRADPWIRALGGFVQVRFGPVRIPTRSPHLTQLRMGLEVVRSILDRALEILFGFHHLSLAGQRYREIVVRRSRIRAGADRQAVLANGDMSFPPLARKQADFRRR